ncbi:MAG TPA: Gfo/Idh/MocA family oxidoreductase [Candidatus Limnocylindria bacterium]|nr:Gfo/Idh/MocA family oxidoreductase [Candidatus Limnocylindria bacterium]
MAIIGCGAAVAGLHASALGKLESRGAARVVALVDPDRSRTAALARRFRSARPFVTAADALASTAPALTIVASPPPLHAEHAVAALTAGSHVLCEKPMAIRAADAERMVAAAEAAERLLAIGMTRRMSTALLEARALIGSGALGDGVRFAYRDGAVYDWPVSTSAPFSRATAGGGALIDLGSHAIDYLSALFGRPSVTAYADDGQGEGVEANCVVDLAFPAATGFAQLSWSQPLVTGVHVVGAAAELRLNPYRPDLLLWRPRGGRWQARQTAVTLPRDAEPRPERGVPRTYYEAIHYQLVQVLRAILHGEPVPVDGEQGLSAVRAIDACYRIAVPLRLPWLSAEEQALADERHWSRQRWLAA